MKELVTWLRWVDEWAGSSAQRGETEEMRERREWFCCGHRVEIALC